LLTEMPEVQVEIFAGMFEPDRRRLASRDGTICRVAVSRQTLCYVFRPGTGGQRQVLLGRKKRGFGAGMIMGLGGKALPGETEAACALREVREEAGIVIDPDSLSWQAELTFIFPSRSDMGAVVTVFFGQRWSGDVRESEEMAPEWFDADSPPLNQMWDDEAYWLPRVLAGETLTGTVTYDDACKLVTRAELRATEESLPVRLR
jgi:8-oxo-dGTP diphosphatase